MWSSSVLRSDWLGEDWTRKSCGILASDWLGMPMWPHHLAALLGLQYSHTPCRAIAVGQAAVSRCPGRTLLVAGADWYRGAVPPPHLPPGHLAALPGAVSITPSPGTCADTPGQAPQQEGDALHLHLHPLPHCPLGFINPASLLSSRLNNPGSFGLSSSVLPPQTPNRACRPAPGSSQSVLLEVQHPTRDPGLQSGRLTSFDCT